jgi:uncharacterized membrane protein YvbJ
VVYCSKCGMLNPDDAAVCSKCGTSLVMSARQDYYARSRRRHYRNEYHMGRRGSGFGVLFAGLIIIIAGLALLFAEIYSIQINWSAWWAIGIVVVGLWLIFVAIRFRSRQYSRNSQM